MTRRKRTTEVGETVVARPFQLPPPKKLCTRTFDDSSTLTTAIQNGKILHFSKQFELSIEYHTHALRIFPHSVDILMARSASYMALGKFRAARIDAHHAHSLSAEPSVFTLVRLSDCHCLLGEIECALSFARCAVLRCESDSNNVNIVEKTAASITLERALEMEKKLSEFFSAMRRLNWSEASQYLETLCEDNKGGQGAAWSRMKAELCIAQGELDDAIFYLQQALGEDDPTPATLYLCALNSFLCDKLDDAASYLTRLDALDQLHIQGRELSNRLHALLGLRERAQSATVEGRFQAALQAFEDMLAVVGQKETEAQGGWLRAGIMIDRAEVFLLMGLCDDALDALPVPLDVDPPWSHRAIHTTARIFVRTRKYNEALCAFAKAKIRAYSMPDARVLIEAEEAELADMLQWEYNDYYRRLGVGRLCSRSEAVKAYRRLSLKHHPDKGGDPEKFKLISEAHETLIDPELRTRYDATLLR